MQHVSLGLRKCTCACAVRGHMLQHQRTHFMPATSFSLVPELAFFSTSTHFTKHSSCRPLALTRTLHVREEAGVVDGAPSAPCRVVDECAVRPGDEAVRVSIHGPTVPAGVVAFESCILEVQSAVLQPEHAPCRSATEMNTFECVLKARLIGVNICSADAYLFAILVTYRHLWDPTTLTTLSAGV